MTKSPTHFAIDQNLKDEYREYVLTTLDQIEKMLASDEINQTWTSWDEARRHLHSLKGTGTYYGFPEITALSGALEDLAKQNDLSALPQLRSGLEEIRQIVSL
jgi:HPt (histidine-containing phosphotransfer) domain-containing protein